VAGQVDRGKQQVADFIGNRIGSLSAMASSTSSSSSRTLSSTGNASGQSKPTWPHALQFGGTRQCRQCGRHIVEQRQLFGLLFPRALRP
jgi:hypothetical protein